MNHIVKLTDFNFVKVDCYQKAGFCVDGRFGKVNNKDYGAYPQLLGGSLHFVVLSRLFNKSENGWNSSIQKIVSALSSLGFKTGVHTSTYSNSSESGCGFADNLRSVFKVFLQNFSKIKGSIDKLSVFDLDLQNWSVIRSLLNKFSIGSIPSGKDLIQMAVKHKALLQSLEGEHQEQAVIINTVEDTTLEISREALSAFNLDVWLVSKVARLFSWDVKLSVGLSLGLYSAVEIVLVEQKGKPPLPVFVR